MQFGKITIAWLAMLAYWLLPPAIGAASAQQSAAWPASDAAVSLTQGQAEGSINWAISYTFEPRNTPVDTMLTASKAASFQRLEKVEPDFGYRRDDIWLRVPIDNPHAAAQQRLLVLHTNFMNALSVYTIAQGPGEKPQPIQLLDQSTASPFSSRPIAFHHLAVPVTFAPEAQTVIYIRYRSQGSTALPMSLETPLSFAQTVSRSLTVDFSFYGVMAMFILASLAGIIMAPNRTFLAYALYASSVLLYIFQRDGYAFQYLWPNAPGWNNFSSLPIGMSLSIFAAYFTRTYLNAASLNRLLDYALLGTIVMQICVLCYGIFIDPMVAKKAGVLTTTLSTLIFLGSGIYAYKRLGLRTLFFVIGWFGIVMASLIMSTAHWLDVTITRTQTLDSMRVAMVFDAFMMGIASVSGIVDLQRDRDALNVQRIAALKANLQMHNRLAALEQKYDLTRTLAESSNKRLEDTTHDLRQPLFALRSAIGGLTSRAASAGAQRAPDTLSEIEQSLDYMEQLVEATLGRTAEQGETQGLGVEGQAETVAAQRILESLSTLFAGGAAEANIDLSILPCSHIVEIPCMPVLRIASNFLTNAVRYAPGARILVGMRRAGPHAIRLEIHDTGPGMAAETLSAMKQRHTRGMQSSSGPSTPQNGKGLGLDIVHSVASANGLVWSIDSWPGKGTVASLDLPLARH